MTLAEIKGAVAAYLHRTVAELSVGGVDLALVAMNQVRMQAELNHNFGFNRKLVTVTVDGVTGGSLSTAVEFGTVTPVKVKSLVDVGILDALGNLSPINWTVVEASLNTQRSDARFLPRYPTDGQAVSAPIGGQRFYFSGDKIYVFPVAANTTFTLQMWVYAFTTDWTNADSTTNIWTLEGSQYIQWASIIHVNHLVKDFVFRQEGNLLPQSPQTLADLGLANIITWDIFKFEQFRRHGR